MTLTWKDSLKWMTLISLVAGTLDGIAATVIYQADPIRLFQMIASAAIGKEIAYSGGLITFALGVVFHYLIATTWSVLFFVLYDKLAILRQNKLLVIIGYGLFVWVMMNLVVVPLNSLNRPFPTFNQFALGASILIVAISLPIVLLTSRAKRSSGRSSPSAI